MISTKKRFQHENFILEKAFWKTFHATREIKEVEEFWLKYFMLTSNMKDYIIENNE